MQNPTANTFDIGFPINTLPGPFLWVSGGTARSNLLSFQALTDATPLGFMRRKTGTFRLQPKGRAPRRPANF